MAKTEAQRRAQVKYLSTVVPVYIRVTREERDAIQAYARRTGESVNQLIRRLVREAMERGD